MTLMFVEGGIKVVLSATIIVSLPLIVVGVLLAVSLVRMLRQDAAADGSASPGITTRNPHS